MKHELKSALIISTAFFILLSTVKAQDNTGWGDISIKKQDGTPFPPEGEVATDEQLVTMNFYVEGITGDIPS